MVLMVTGGSLLRAARRGRQSHLRPTGSGVSGGHGVTTPRSRHHAPHTEDRTEPGRVGDRGPPRLAAPLGALDPVDVHQPLDAVAADLDAVAPQRQPRAPVAVAGEVLGVDVADTLKQDGVLGPAARKHAGAALVVGRCRHPERPARELDGKASGLPVFDEGAHLRGVPTSSFAKNTDADFKISFALRSPRFPRSSWRSRSRSAVVSRSGRSPASASAWRTQPRNDSR